VSFCAGSCNDSTRVQRPLAGVSSVDFELPACDEGMALLKLWAQNDATLAPELPKVPENAKGTLAQDFYRHVAQCPKCNEL